MTNVKLLEEILKALDNETIFIPNKNDFNTENLTALADDLDKYSKKLKAFSKELRKEIEKRCQQ